MGLSHCYAALRKGFPAVLPAALIAALAGLLWWAGPGVTEMLRFDRAAISSGQYWRLVSGHFVHLGGAHAALNAAGVVLVWMLVGQAFRWRVWVLVSLAVILLIDAGLWWWSPQLGWYVGLSGLLHGWLAAGICGTASSRRADAMLLGAILAAKLIFEQRYGALPGSEATAGGPVVVDAHLYGALGGLLAGALAVLVRVTARARL